MPLCATDNRVPSEGTCNMTIRVGKKVTWKNFCSSCGKTFMFATTLYISGLSLSSYLQE